MKPKDITTNPRLAGLVKRYHTWPTLTTQSIGEHSWQVYRIYYEIYGGVPAVVAHHIMSHDMGEITVGDPPYPIKANNKDLKKTYDKMEIQAISDMGHCCPNVPKDEVAKIKLCHMLEMMEFGLHEMALGNEYAKPIFERCQDAAQDMVALMGDAKFRARALRYIRSAERRLA